MNSKEITSPFVSIVIPAFNKAALLIEMVESIVKQTYENWELIIVDDGSSEEEFQKVHSFVSKDARITHLRRYREPKNGDTCRNIAMEMAKGEYIIIFDADDIISPTCIENRVDFMQSHPDCDYASFPYAYFNNGEEWSFENVNKQFKFVPEEKMLSYFLQADYPFTVWSNIYRKDIICNLNWDENVFVYQDFDFMVRCILAGLKHMYCDGDPDYFYRQFSDGQNVSGNFVSDLKSSSTIYLFSKTLNSLEERKDRVKRKSQFKKFLSLHFKRLLKNPSNQSIEKYIALLKKHYNKAYVCRYKVVYFLTLMCGYNRFIVKILDV